MALITCKECSTEVSSTAETCPKCGARVKPKSQTGLKVLAWVLGVPFALFIFFAVQGSNDPQIQAMQEDRRVMEVCLKDMNDPLRSRSFREAARWMCDGLRDKFVAKYHREP